MKQITRTEMNDILASVADRGSLTAAEIRDAIAHVAERGATRLEALPNPPPMSPLEGIDLIELGELREILGMQPSESEQYWFARCQQAMRREIREGRSQEPMGAQALWARMVHLRCTTEVQIVTSGYDDRSVTYRSRWTMTLDDWGGVLRWNSKDEVVKALLVLTGRTPSEVLAAVEGVPTKYVSTWERPDASMYATTPVRPLVLAAFGDLATHEARKGGSLTPVAVAERQALVATATKDEVDAARWWLNECNRANARSGRPQVNFPSSVVG